MKATAKPNTSSNIKPMDGSPQLGVLTGGQYVYGDLSPTGTDIINFNHYYTVSGEKIPLAKKCKVFIGNNLVLSNDVENETPPPPPTTPPVAYPPVSFAFDFNEPTTLTIFSDVEVKTIIYNGQTLKDETDG